MEEESLTYNIESSTQTINGKQVTVEQHKFISNKKITTLEMIPAQVTSNNSDSHLFIIKFNGTVLEYNFHTCHKRDIKEITAETVEQFLADTKKSKCHVYQERKNLQELVQNILNNGHRVAVINSGFLPETHMALDLLLGSKLIEQITIIKRPELTGGKTIALGIKILQQKFSTKKTYLFDNINYHSIHEFLPDCCVVQSNHHTLLEKLKKLKQQLTITKQEITHQAVIDKNKEIISLLGCKSDQPHNDIPFPIEQELSEQSPIKAKNIFIIEEQKHVPHPDELEQSVKTLLTSDEKVSIVNEDVYSAQSEIQEDTPLDGESKQTHKTKSSFTKRIINLVNIIIDTLRTVFYKLIACKNSNQDVSTQNASNYKHETTEEHHSYKKNDYNEIPTEEHHPNKKDNTSCLTSVTTITTQKKDRNL